MAEWFGNMSPAKISLIVSAIVSFFVTGVGCYVSYRLALRRDDRNRRLVKEDHEKEYLESISLDNDQGDIIEKCKKSGQKKFKTIFVEDISEIKVESGNRKIYESRDVDKVRYDLHVLDEYGYIKITQEGDVLGSFYLTDPQPDERP